MEKKFTLVIVRHGEGFHNLGLNRNELEFTDDANLIRVNSELTEKGLMQANLVGNRLKDIKFDLAITSDLKGTMQTAEAIMNKNESINKLIPWEIVRERSFGDFECVWKFHNALATVEKAVNDREYLTWRPPNGESVVDLRIRVKQFLKELQKEAMELSADSPTILVSSHGLFMIELYHVLSSSEYGKTIPKEAPGYQNTALAQYSFITSFSDNDNYVLKEVKCTTLSCASHLENHHHNENYALCIGGCHGVANDVKQG